MADLAASKITQGALDAIFNINDPERLQREFPVPICQCLQVKPLGSQGSGAAQGSGNPERYRIVLSDIKNFVQSTGAAASHLVQQQKLKRGSFVRLKSFQANAVKGKRILIILDLDVIEELGEHEKIGEPKPLRDMDEAEGPKPTSATVPTNGFYGNRPQQVEAQNPTIPSRPITTSSISHANIYPIEALSPYQQKWTIKARVSSKSDIRTWHKQSSEGKLFSVNLLDESGEIKATAFNEQCDMLYDVLQEGSVYYISTPCRTSLAKKHFTNLPHDYELTFERDTLVEKAEDHDNIPQNRFNFTKIGDLQLVEKDNTIDVIGILKEVSEVQQITSKTTNKPYDKRELTLVDESGFSVRLTVWGKTAVSFDTSPESIVAFKGAKVSDFGGRSLSLLASGSMMINPDIQEAHMLKGWYDSQGRSNAFSSHSGMASAAAAGGRQDPLKTVAQVREENLGSSDKDDYFSMRSTIVYIKDNFSYPACLNTFCNKKVIVAADGTWRCEKCEISHPKPEYRYLMSLSVNDHTGQLWLTCFDDIGRKIIGRSADQMMELKEESEDALKQAFEDVMCKTMMFKVRARTDNFQEQQRIRYQVLEANPVNFTVEAQKLAELIKGYHVY